MNALARFGRLVLAWQAALHRFRVLPLLHADAILMIFLFAVAVVAGQATAESLQSGREPEPVTLSRIFSPQPMKNRFVEVKSLLLPETRLRYPPTTRGLERPVQFAYVAMLDDDHANVLLARFQGDLGHGEPRHVTVSGMLQPPDSLLRRLLDPKRWHLMGVPIERRYVLVANMTPKPLWLFGPACLLSGGMALALLIAMSRSRSLNTEPNKGA